MIFFKDYLGRKARNYAGLSGYDQNIYGGRLQGGLSVFGKILLVY